MTKRSEGGTAEITTDLRSVSSTDELKLAGISYSDQLLDFIQSEDPPGDDSLADILQTLFPLDPTKWFSSPVPVSNTKTTRFWHSLRRRVLYLLEVAGVTPAPTKSVAGSRG